MRFALQHRDCRNVEHIAICGLERANAALAQDDLVIAARGDVLGRHQPFADRCAHATLQDDGHIDATLDCGRVLNQRAGRVRCVRGRDADADTRIGIGADVDGVGSCPDRQLGDAQAVLERLAMLLEVLDGVEPAPQRQLAAELRA